MDCEVLGRKVDSAPSVNHLPPCCASCPELDAPARACRLLASPSLESRHRLLTMPCDVSRLLRQRFRGHGEDVAQKAMLAWLDPRRKEEDLSGSYGDAPRDARIWLTDWPYRALARNAVAQKLADTEPPTPKDAPGGTTHGETDPVLFARTAASLARLSTIDPAGYAMMIDSLRGSFQPTDWRASLGATDVSIADRRALSLYRYLVLFFDVLDGLEPRTSASAVRTRRFVPNDNSDAAALSAMRDELGDKKLPIGDFRSHYKDGIEKSFALLADESAFGKAAFTLVESAFRRVLRVEGPAGGETLSDDLSKNLEGHSASAGTASADDHLSPDVIATLATGALEGPAVATASRHLLSCRDRRCCAFLRWEVGGKEAVRRDLSGPMSEPPPGMSVTFTQGPSSQHLVDCRDVLWNAFTQMARAEGRSIDDLVNDAMARYRTIREYADPPPAPKAPSIARPSSFPPRARSSFPPARSSSIPPPPSRSRPPMMEDEITPPEGAVRRNSKPPEAPISRSPDSLRGLASGASQALPSGTAEAPPSRTAPVPSIPRPALVPNDVRGSQGVANATTQTLGSMSGAAKPSSPPPAAGPPPVPEWARDASEPSGTAPATIRAPELQPPDATPSETARTASVERQVPRPVDSSRTLPGVSPPSADLASSPPPARAIPIQPTHTVELAAHLTAGPSVEPARPPPAPSTDTIDEKLEALPSRGSGFDDAEDTSPKMNLSPLNPPLFVEYAGRRGHVNALRFVIGRERTTCHLVLPDSNVSRQHAIVEWVNGQYFLVDQGSTNGVGCGGHRIHRKQIVEGDRFDICGHTITFSFRM